MKIVLTLFLTLLLMFTPGMLRADDDDPKTTIGSGTTPPPPPPSPGGEVIVVPSPKDPELPPPVKHKLPSRDRIYLYYTDYTLIVLYNGEFLESKIELRSVQTDAVYSLECIENEQEFYLPLEAGDYNVTVTTVSDKTYRGVLILE